MYFIVSGTVIRASSQIRKKLSTVVRDVKIYGRMIQYLDPLLPELLERNARNPNERMIIDGYALSARQFEERRFFGG